MSNDILKQLDNIGRLLGIEPKPKSKRPRTSVAASLPPLNFRMVARSCQTCRFHEHDSDYGVWTCTRPNGPVKDVGDYPASEMVCDRWVKHHER